MLLKFLCPASAAKAAATKSCDLYEVGVLPPCSRYPSLMRSLEFRFVAETKNEFILDFFILEPDNKNEGKNLEKVENTSRRLAVLHRWLRNFVSDHWSAIAITIFIFVSNSVVVSRGFQCFFQIKTGAPSVSVAFETIFLQIQLNTVFRGQSRRFPVQRKFRPINSIQFLRRFGSIFCWDKNSMGGHVTTIVFEFFESANFASIQIVDSKISFTFFFNQIIFFQICALKSKSKSKSIKIKIPMHSSGPQQQMLG